MRKGQVSGAALLCVALAAPGYASDAGMRFVPSMVAGAPAHAVPVSPAEAQTAVMRGIIEEILEERHRLAGVEPDLAELERIAGYGLPEAGPDGRGPEIGAGAAGDAFHAGFDGLDAGDPDAADAGSFLAGLVATDQGLETLSRMTPEQIEAVSLLALALQDPAGMRDVLGGPAPAPWRAVPPSVSPPGAMAVPASYTPPIQTSMLLRGWTVRMDRFGRTFMLQDGAPEAGIEIDEGMVVGALGRIVDIRRFGDQVIVNFESGDTLSGGIEPAVMAPGIPPLDFDPAIMEEATAEILLSGIPVGMEALRTVSTSGTLDAPRVLDLDDLVVPAGRYRLIVIQVPDAGTTRPKPRPGTPKQD